MKKTIILLINGAATSGKDLFIDSLQFADHYTVSRTSIIDPAKKIAIQVGWRGRKEEKDRKFLAELKTLLDNYKGFSFNATIDFVAGKMAEFNYSFNPEKMAHIVCIIAREPRDIEAFKTYFTDQGIQVESILIRRAEAEKNLPDNHADQGIFDYNYSIQIANNGSIEDFKKTAISVVEKILTGTEKK